MTRGRRDVETPYDKYPMKRTSSPLKCLKCLEFESSRITKNPRKSPFIPLFQRGILISSLYQREGGRDFKG
jgi:hypothetical protein